MINMIKAELYRMTKTKGIWLFWIFTALIFFISMVYKEPGGIMFGPVDMELPSNPYKVKLDIGQVSFNFTFYFLLLIPVFSVIVAEFNEHTVKNTISSSVSKSLYFVSKFVFALVYSLLSFMAANFLFYFVNRLVNGSKYSSPIENFVKAFFTQLPLFVAVISAFIFLAFLLRKGAAFNAVTIIFPLAYTMVSQIMSGIESANNVGEKLMKYDLSVMMCNLAISPTDSYRSKCYIICAAVTVLSFGLGYLSFTKTEI